jgi:rubredoxin
VSATVRLVQDELPSAYHGRFIRKGLACKALDKYNACLTGSIATKPGTWGSMMRKWQCVVCGLVYDESLGWPDDGIAPGTRWEDVPADWLCPDCGVGKADFEMIEIN